MRIPEKTIELNFCKGFPQLLGHDLIWFGLTQKQEAKAGFDACARSNSTLMLFQLKASNNLLKNGTRRFLAEHDQMQVLRNQVKKNRLVYYVLPIIGTTPEIIHGLCFSHCSRYLDISQLPPTIPFPYAKGTKPPTKRKNNCHYVDLAPNLATATIHSDPFEVKLLSADDLKNTLNSREENLPENSEFIKWHQQQAVLEENSNSREFHEFWASISRVNRSSLMAAYRI